jgi:hypothetical protein
MKIVGLVLSFLFLMLVFNGYADVYKHHADGNTTKSGEQPGPDESMAWAKIDQSVSCNETNPMCKDGKLRYKIINKHNIPFNPHKVLDEWKSVAQFPMPPQMWIVVMGHPEIEWDKVPEELEPGLAIKPEGVDYAAVFFTFMIIPGTPDKMSNATAALIMIAYRDPKYGTMQLHKLSEDKSEYELISVEEVKRLREEIKRHSSTICRFSY